MAITQTQQDLAAAVRDWAARADGPAGFDLPGIGIAEDRGGSGGDRTDLAVALAEAAAALVPGPVLSTVAVAQLLDGDVTNLVTGRETAGIAVQSGSPVPVLGGDDTAHTLLGTAQDRWYLVPPRSGMLRWAPRAAADPSRALADVTVTGPLHEDWLVPGLHGDRVRDTVVALAAAEAAGLAGWCVQTAAEYAKVREQFGAPIGSFQAVKHLCATMLCRAESAGAAAWDAVRAGPDEPLAAAVAGAVCLDAAVDNAKDCIQVLGGIGFTWEHPAHRYLRRALVLREFTGGAGCWRARVHALAAAGARRVPRVELPVPDAERADIRAAVAAVAALDHEQRRKALVDNGLLVPHWPPPHGRGAGVAAQLVIDEELGRAGVTRPALVIGSWALATIIAHGTDEQRAAFVQPTLLGELTWCQLFSEPGAGSDLAGLRTRADRVPGGWSLTGQKVWTSQAAEADWAICLARTDQEAPKHRGITYFLVDMRTAGITVRPLREITGDALFNEVFLDGVVVPDDRVVGAVHGGWPLARGTLAAERVALATDSALGGGLEALLAAPADPVLADRIGGLVAEAVTGRVLDLRTALRGMAGHGGAGAEASVRKLIGVRHRQEVAELALTVAGTADPDALHEFLLSRCLSIAGGTTQILLTAAAERILGLPR